jgi:DNA polymerase III epsilon subunit-like protein
MVYIAILDFETSGFYTYDNHLIEIGCVLRRGTECHEYCAFIRPGASWSGLLHKNNKAVHGIQEAQLIGQPRFDQISREFFFWLDAHTAHHADERIVFVAHNGFKFDFPFWFSEWVKYGVQRPKQWFARLDFMDSLPYFRQMCPELGRHKLDIVHRHFFKRAITNAHRAIGDCRALDACLNAQGLYTHDIETRHQSSWCMSFEKQWALFVTMTKKWVAEDVLNITCCYAPSAISQTTATVDASVVVAPPPPALPTIDRDVIAWFKAHSFTKKRFVSAIENNSQSLLEARLMTYAQCRGKSWNIDTIHSVVEYFINGGDDE